jgi:hypothetical protein
VARRADGFVSRIIVQNVDADPASPTAQFIAPDGTTTTKPLGVIQPGRSAIIDLGTERDLADGRYAMRVSASARLVAIVNTHRDGPADPAPLLYAYGGLTSGANMVYGPYAVKNVPGIGGGNSTITVQNMATAATQPSLSFTPLGGGVSIQFDGPTLGPGAAWSFDLRFRNGHVRESPCDRGTVSGCLGDGEYSLTAGASGAQLAALVTLISSTTAAAYGALSRSGDFFLPNVTRTLGGRDGWTTPIVVQSVSASRVTLSWYRFVDGRLAATLRMPILPGSALRIDPREVAGLSENTQYAVVVEGNGGRLVALVVELNFQGGDGAAIYTGFFR